jgi:hypothetical protein
VGCQSAAAQSKQHGKSLVSVRMKMRHALEQKSGNEILERCSSATDGTRPCRGSWGRFVHVVASRHEALRAAA